MFIVSWSASGLFRARLDPTRARFFLVGCRSQKCGKNKARLVPALGLAPFDRIERSAVVSSAVGRGRLVSSPQRGRRAGKCRECRVARAAPFAVSLFQSNALALLLPLARLP